MVKNFFRIIKDVGLYQSIFFGILNIVVLILELLSFSVFIPFLLALTNKDKLLSNSYFLSFLDILQIEHNNFNKIIFVLFIIIIIVFFFKNLFIGISKYFQYKLLSNIEIKLTSTVFKKYLRKPYLFHTSQNSSKAIRDIISESGMFSRALLNSVINIFIEFVVLIGIFVILFLNQPAVTIKLLLFFSILGFIFYFVFKKKFNLLGRERQIEDKQRIKYVQQGIQGIKEIIVFNLQNFLLKLFNSSNFKVLRSIHFAGFINQVPKLFFEFLAILAILVIFYTQEEIQNDINQQIFLFGLIAAAAFRIFPAINKILLSLNTFEYSKPSIKVLSEIFKEDEKNKNIYNFENANVINKNVSLKNLIEIKDLKFSYPSSEKIILNGLNLKIFKGEHIGIMGQTGSGKSTLLDLILGILEPNSGDIVIDNKSIFKDLHNWRNIIGYVSQFPYLLDGSIRENIAIGLNKSQTIDTKILMSLEIANLKDYVLGLNNGLSSSVGERGVQLSGGQIQRLAIARALFRNPDILILDEATASIDSRTQRSIISDLSKFKNKFNLISISHDEDALIYCDKVYELKDRKLILK